MKHATPFDVVKHVLGRGGGNTAVIARGHACQFVNNQDVARHVSDLDAVTLREVPGRPTFHWIGLGPGRSGKPQKQGNNYQNAKEYPNAGELFCSHDRRLPSVL